LTEQNKERFWISRIWKSQLLIWQKKAKGKEKKKRYQKFKSIVKEDKSYRCLKKNKRTSDPKHLFLV
jgi:dsRNA-specific ribonuclease